MTDQPREWRDEHHALMRRQRARRRDLFGYLQGIPVFADDDDRAVEAKRSALKPTGE